jgi:uncharacterized protein (UPF0335 family)
LTSGAVRGTWSPDHIIRPSTARPAAVETVFGQVVPFYGPHRLSIEERKSMSDEVMGAEPVAAAELKQFIERIERLEEEKAAISGDIKDVMGEAKGRGYDTKAIRTIIRLRKQDANERIEEETILQTYMAALGME